jgi:DNA-binding NtrC family response regulator
MKMYVVTKSVIDSNIAIDAEIHNPNVCRLISIFASKTTEQITLIQAPDALSARYWGALAFLVGKRSGEWIDSTGVKRSGKWTENPFRGMAIQNIDLYKALQNSIRVVWQQMIGLSGDNISELSRVLNVNRKTIYAELARTGSTNKQPKKRKKRKNPNKGLIVERTYGGTYYG